MVGSDGKTEQVGTEARKQHVGAEVDIAKHECKQDVGAEVDISNHEATEDDIVFLAECMTHVGRNDRWSRVANGKGKGIVSKQRGRDLDSGRGACRKSIGLHGKAYETDEDYDKYRDQANNPKRSLDINVSVIDRDGSGGQAHDNASSTTTNDDHDPHTPDNPVPTLHKMFEMQPHPNRRPRDDMTPPRVPPGLNPLSPVASKRGRPIDQSRSAKKRLQ